MARTCSICVHPTRHNIEKALVDGATFRDIAGRFSVSRSALERHKKDHLAQSLADNVGPEIVPLVSHIAAKRDSNRTSSIDILQEIGQQIARVNMLSDAVDAWLRDPESPETYSLAPRADEVQVIYLDCRNLDNGEKPKRRKDTLAELLDRVEAGNYEVVSLTTRHADPRTLLLAAADGLKGQLTLMATILEKLSSAREVETFRAITLEAIGEVAPDVRDAIADRLSRRHALLAGRGRSGQ